MRTVNGIILLIVIIGALNWGMVGFFNMDIIRGIFSPLVSRIIFAIVGVAGLWSFSFFKYLSTCRHHPGGVCLCCKNDCKNCTCGKKG